MLEEGRIIDDEIKKYINEIDVKIKYHLYQASNSNGWYQLLSLCSTVLSSGCTLAMCILGVKDVSNITIASVGGVFGFLLTISQKVQSSYNFNMLSVLHYHAHDSYTDVKNDFLTIQRHLDNGHFSENEFERAVIRLTYTKDKSHITPVKNCFFISCFLEK